MVIPCYDEEKRISPSFYQAFLSANQDICLLFVNDGSRDKTQSVIDNLAQNFDNAELLIIDKNGGKGEAVRKGVLHSLSAFEFEYIGFADADLSTPLNEFLYFRNKLREELNLNIVLGSRVQMLGKDIQRNLFRHWFGRIIATGIGKVIMEPVYDTQCGAKLFTKEIARELFSDPFTSKWLFDVELLCRYKIKYGSETFRSTIIEMPVSQWTEKLNSKLRYHHFFRIMYDLMRIRKRYFRAK